MTTHGVWAAGGSLEFAIPRSELGGGDTVAFTVSVERASIVIERHPQRQPIRVECPRPDYTARHWRA